MPCRAIADWDLLSCALLPILLSLSMEHAALSSACLRLQLRGLRLKVLLANRLRGSRRTAAMQWGASRGAAAGSWWAAAARTSSWQQSAGACRPCLLLAGPRACPSLPAELVKGLLLLAAGWGVYSGACWLLRRAGAAPPLAVRVPALLLQAWLLLICRSRYVQSMPLQSRSGASGMQLTAASRIHCSLAPCHLSVQGTERRWRQYRLCFVLLSTLLRDPARFLNANSRVV